MSPLPAVFFAVFWMWSDLIGTLLSVISTYFYFGWEGTPQLELKIFGIALLAFSGPLAYRLGFYRLPPERLARGLLLLLFALYLSLALNRQSDFFAWGSVLAAWLGGLTLMTCLRSLNSFHYGQLPFYIVQVAFLFYLSTRISLGGIPLLISSGHPLALVSWATLGVMVLLGLSLPHRVKNQPPENSSPFPRSMGSLGVVFGLLMGLSVGLIENLHIWSAQTPSTPPAAYFLSLATGSCLGWLAFVKLQHLRFVLLAAAGLSMGLGLYPLLYGHYNLIMGLLAHFGCVWGLSVCWSFFLERLAKRQSQAPFFPWLGLQTGFIALLLILALFLLKANPGGFWVGLALTLLILAWQESREPALTPQTTRLQQIWIYACSLFALMGVGSLFLPQRTVAETPQQGPLTLMSSNIRYGWTDDYRFDPMPHVRWLREHPVDLLGLQEVNHGHTSGAYSDLFTLYQRVIPGHWFYGDAHFGFGNALLSRLPVEHSEVRTYSAKDLLKRSCLVTTVKYQQQLIDVYVTHLSHLPPPNPVREAQLNELLGWLKSSSRPWIVLGDFNAEPDSPEVKQLKALAHPLFSQKPELLAGLSFPAEKPMRRIDYIFFSPQFQLQKMDILDNQTTSDHRPIRAALTLNAASVKASP